MLSESMVGGTFLTSECLGCDFDFIKQIGEKGISHFVSQLLIKYCLDEQSSTFELLDDKSSITGAVVFSEGYITLRTWSEKMIASLHIFLHEKVQDKEKKLIALQVDIENTLFCPDQVNMKFVNQSVQKGE